MKPSDRKNFEIEYEKLKKESDEMRYDFSKEMDLCLNGLDDCMNSNLQCLQSFFAKFYNIGKHWSQLELHEIDKFKEDIEKLDISQKYQEYLDVEVPSYNPELILSDELDGSIISLYLRDKGTILPQVNDMETSFNFGADEGF